MTNPIIPSMTISSVLSTILTISGGGDDDNSDGGVGNGGDDIRIFGGDGYYDSERTVDDNSYHTYWLLVRTTVLLAAVASPIGVKMSKIPSTPVLASIPTSSSSISTSFNDKIRRLSGGALQSLENDKKRGSKGILNLTPKALSVINMAVAMSLHYLSYSLARPVSFFKTILSFSFLFPLIIVPFFISNLFSNIFSRHPFSFCVATNKQNN